MPTASKLTSPLTLPISLHGDSIGVYKPLSIATSGAAEATAHLNINTGSPTTDAQMLSELLEHAESIGWVVHNFTTITNGTLTSDVNHSNTRQLESHLQTHLETIHKAGHYSWSAWVKAYKNRIPATKAPPILVAFTHTAEDGPLEPLLESILIAGRKNGVHAVHVGPLSALGGAHQSMIDLTVTSTTPYGHTALVHPPRNIPI